MLIHNQALKLQVGLSASTAIVPVFETGVSKTAVTNEEFIFAIIAAQNFIALNTEFTKL